MPTGERGTIADPNMIAGLARRSTSDEATSGVPAKSDVPATTAGRTPTTNSRPERSLSADAVLPALPNQTRVAKNFSIKNICDRPR